MAMDVTEPMKVSTVSSVYLVSPTKFGSIAGHRVKKIKDLTGKENKRFPVGWEREGVGLYLELGERMGLGDFLTSEVLNIEYVEPHH